MKKSCYLPKKTQKPKNPKPLPSPPPAAICVCTRSAQGSGQWPAALLAAHRD
jgi:hypothetical protein